MTDGDLTLSTMTDAELGLYVDGILARDLQDQAFDEAVGDLPALHDELRSTQRNYIAEHMLARLNRRISNTEPLDAVAVNILSLADPFFVRSDHALEAQMAIGSAFAVENWDRLPFENLVAMGGALAELDYNPPGAEEIWGAFYDRFGQDEETSVDALDVALAGLANLGVGPFAKLAAQVSDKSVMADRWEIYLSYLVKESGRGAVEEALAAFLPEASAQDARRLRAVCRSRGLNLVDQVLHVVSSGDAADRDDATPRALQFAHEIFQAEVRNLGNDSDQLLENDPIIHVVQSDYTQTDLIAQFQLAVRDTVRTLDRPELVTYQPTSSFAELPPDGTLLQRYIYAFPTYLTSNKRRAGYAVLPFGQHRRLGAIFRRNSSLYLQEDRRTLVELLREMKQNQGSRLYSLQNFAMAEMVLQCLGKYPDVRNGFDIGSIRALTETPQSKRWYVPLEAFAENEADSVFLFDLAGLSKVEEQIALNKTKGPLRAFAGARVVVIDHDLDIQVGIGLNRYAAEWSLQKGRWQALQALALEWAENEDFREVMSKLGVDVSAPSKSAVQSNGQVRTLKKKR